MAISLSALGVNLDRLYHGQPTVAGATLYVAPGSGGARTLVSSIKIANPSDAPLTVRLGLIPSDGSADGTHYLLGDLIIAAHDAYESDVTTVLRHGDTLEGQSASLPAPSFPPGITATGAAAAYATGGTLAAAQYYYKLTATNANGETLATAEIPVVTAGSTGSVVIRWARLLGATGYKVYRSTTSGAEVLIATVSGGSTTSYTDTGATAGSATPPTTGTAAGCIFTICGSELPA